MSQKAFDALAYFAQVGAAIDTAARANTALTAQRIQQILFACRRVTVDVIQMSLRTLLSASTKAAAVLLVGTVLASRAARPKNKRKGREPLSDQELMAASGVAMSSAWLCFRSGSPRG
jgi:type III secretory pathway component EscU